VESVYSAVRTESLFKQIRFVFKGLIFVSGAEPILMSCVNIGLPARGQVILKTKLQACNLGTGQAGSQLYIPAFDLCGARPGSCSGS
jgi:hypothetical protein